MQATELQQNKSSVNEKQLTLKYALVWLFMVVLTIIVTSVISYSFLRSQGIHSTIAKMLDVIPHATNLTELVTGESVDKPHATAFAHFSQTPSIVEASLFSADGILLASSNINQKLSHKDLSQARKLFKKERLYYIDDARFYEKRFWQGILSSKGDVVPVLLSLRYPDGSVNSVARLMVNFKPSIERAKRYVLFIFGMLLVFSVIAFEMLYSRFRASIITIKRQSEELNQQIDSLSELLSTNNELRLSMKTASSRAVELNEQFLRRTGADLHDGPAQLIGYAMLRLNQMSSKAQVKELGHEFHAIKEALETSLDEIRDISSGLVLPELQEMTLEQCLSQVVALHAVKSDCKVKEYYKDLPTEMSLPVKICAYRFVQEGLNNAERHGKAVKCRVTGNVTNGILHVSLKDNGIGFRKSLLETRSASLGLLGLKDRIESLGGIFSINSKLGVGTALKLSIDLNDNN